MPMPMSGSGTPVYLCSCLHVVNGWGDRQFGRVIQIVGAPNVDYELLSMGGSALMSPC
jgi:hypothetical protein